MMVSENETELIHVNFSSLAYASLGGSNQIARHHIFGMDFDR